LDGESIRLGNHVEWSDERRGGRPTPVRAASFGALGNGVPKPNRRRRQHCPTWISPAAELNPARSHGRAAAIHL
jgi:hypothetical protein